MLIGAEEDKKGYTIFGASTIILKDDEYNDDIGRRVIMRLNIGSTNNRYSLSNRAGRTDAHEILVDALAVASGETTEGILDRKIGKITFTMPGVDSSSNAACVLDIDSLLRDIFRDKSIDDEFIYSIENSRIFGHGIDRMSYDGFRVSTGSDMELHVGVPQRYGNTYPRTQLLFTIFPQTQMNTGYAWNGVTLIIFAVE